MITLLKNVKMLAIVAALGLGVTAVAQPARADAVTVRTQVYAAPAPAYSAPSSSVFTGPTFVPNPCGPGFSIGYR